MEFLKSRVLEMTAESKSMLLETFQHLISGDGNKKKARAFGSIYLAVFFICYTMLSSVFPMGGLQDRTENWIVSANQTEDSKTANADIIVGLKDQILSKGLLDSLDLSGEADEIADNLNGSDTGSDTATGGVTTPTKPVQPTPPVKVVIKNPISACVIRVDGVDVASLGTLGDAEQVLENLKSPYKLKENSKNGLVGFAENVEIVQTDVEMGTVKSVEEATKSILTGGAETKTHVVKNGESIWGIARANNTTVKAISEANPGLNIDLVHIGDKLNLVALVPYIRIKTQETLTLKEAMPFKSSTVTSKSLYKNQTEVKIKGKNGSHTIVADVVKINGKVVSKTILSETIHKQPVNEVLVKGTKALPSSVGTLKFMRPSRGATTSSFGSRWGRLHAGMDIDGNTGDPIYAADNGKVIFTGYDASLGWLTKISHGNGYETWYGHQSKILVSVGDVVAKGMKIGKIGNTGRSTGSHLHFQVMKNDTAVNPARFLK